MNIQEALRQMTFEERTSAKERKFENLSNEDVKNIVKIMTR